MVLLPRWQRPGVLRSLGNHEARIRALERLLRAAGIRCSFENECLWFELTTTGEKPGTDTGIGLIVTNGKDFDITMVGGGNWSVTNGVGQIFCTSQPSLLSGGSARIRASSSGVLLQLLAAGKTFTLLDHLGNPMLEMTDGSPDLHIPAGGNLVADL